MKKVKMVLVAVCLAALSGCAMPNSMNDQPQTQVKTDYEKFCNVDMTQVVPGSYRVRKTDQKYFYIDSLGNVYSMDELNKLKDEQSNVGNQVKDQVAGALNSFIGRSVVPEAVSQADINNVKQVVVRQFVREKQPDQHYCTAINSSDDQPQRFSGKRYILQVRNNLTKEQDENMNVDLYNNVQEKNILITPLR